MQKILDEMESYANQHKICIVRPKTRQFLIDLCKKNNPKTILEVGTAIGFSASTMLLNCDANITCAEASAPNIVLAKQNFEKLGLSERVNIVFGNCLNTLPEINQQFDLIFLDGPKGLYPDILKLLLPKLAKNGVLVADNVSFRGMVDGKSQITEPRFEITVKALKTFLNDLTSNPLLETQIFFDLDDGVAVAKWRKND